jgi:hypothetical protein
LVFVALIFGETGFEIVNRNIRARERKRRKIKIIGIGFFTSITGMTIEEAQKQP